MIVLQNIEVRLGVHEVRLNALDNGAQPDLATRIRNHESQLQGLSVPNPADPLPVAPTSYYSY